LLNNTYVNPLSLVKNWVWDAWKMIDIVG
jgi:hypothetical protein